MLVVASAIAAGLFAVAWFAVRRRRPHVPSFVERARLRGLDLRLARRLEVQAREISPERPERVLHSRELFEWAALRLLCAQRESTVAYGCAEAFAAALGKLGLARYGDLPDPMRRVLLRTQDSSKLLGIILANAGGVLTVVLPPDAPFDLSPGASLWLMYGGEEQMLEYPLQLVGQEGGAEGRLVHLARSQRKGEIGRYQRRFPTLLRADITPVDDESATRIPAEIAGEALDLSLGGICLNCEQPIETGTLLTVALDLEDGFSDPLLAKARVVWSHVDPARSWRHGLSFVTLASEEAYRLRQFLDLQRGVTPPSRSERPVTTAAVVPAGEYW